MMQVQLNDKLYQQLEVIVQDSQEFSDVASYVSYILEQVVQKKQQASASVTPAKNTNYSQADEEKIRERLKNLGYLD